MSGVYVYCIGRPDHPPPADVAGIDDAPVRHRDIAGFRVWLSPMSSAPTASLDRVRRHNLVVERAAERATPLPLRFGQWFADADELEESLESRGGGLRRALDRVAGALEFGVRVVDPASRPPERDRSSGRAYLEGLARRERAAAAARERAAGLAAEVREWLGPLVREQRAAPLGSPDGLVKLAHLVDRHDTGSYDGRVRALPDRHPTLRFVFSGPWPPYGFVEEASPDE